MSRYITVTRAVLKKLEKMPSFQEEAQRLLQQYDDEVVTVVPGAAFDCPMPLSYWRKQPSFPGLAERIAYAEDTKHPLLVSDEAFLILSSCDSK
jgi:hypothetical protein